jgi:hypothetical protein
MVSILSFYEGEIDPYKSILNDVRSVYPNVLIFKVQIKENPKMTELYDIKIRPTMVFCSRNSEHNRCEGMVSRDDVFTILKELTESGRIIHKDWGDYDDDNEWR